MLELKSAFGFPAALLISLARLKYLALSNVNLDADEEISCIGRFISRWRIPRSNQNAHENSLKFRRCPAHITEVGVDANVRKRIC